MAAFSGGFVLNRPSTEGKPKKRKRLSGHSALAVAGLPLRPKVGQSPGLDERRWTATAQRRRGRPDSLCRPPPCRLATRQTGCHNCPPPASPPLFAPGRPIFRCEDRPPTCLNRFLMRRTKNLTFVRRVNKLIHRLQKGSARRAWAASGTVHRRPPGGVVRRDVVYFRHTCEASPVPGVLPCPALHPLQGSSSAMSAARFSDTRRRRSCAASRSQPPRRSRRSSGRRATVQKASFWCVSAAKTPRSTRRRPLARSPSWPFPFRATAKSTLSSRFFKAARWWSRSSMRSASAGWSTASRRPTASGPCGWRPRAFPLRRRTSRTWCRSSSRAARRSFARPSLGACWPSTRTSTLASTGPKDRTSSLRSRPSGCSAT